MREKEEQRTTPGFLLSFEPECCHFLGQHCRESRLVSGPQGGGTGRAAGGEEPSVQRGQVRFQSAIRHLREDFT